MTVDEVQFVLDAIKDHYGTALADIPLERIDRDNSDLLDDSPVHQHSEDLQEMNYVGASLVGRVAEPVGTEYDHQLETRVGIRVEGAHVSEFGAIDPQAGTGDADSVSWTTVQWDDLVENIRRAILNDRSFPSVGRSNVGYKDLFLENEADQSSEYSDYYRYDADVVFRGFETLP